MCSSDLVLFPLLIIIATQLVGAEAAGRFSMAFVIANLLQFIGMSHGLEVDSRRADQVGPVLGVVVVEVGLMLEVVRIDLAGGKRLVRCHVVGELLHFEGIAFGGQHALHPLENLGMV